MGVEVVLHGDQRIRKGGSLLWIPGGLLDRQLILPRVHRGQQSNQREQAEQGGRDAHNRPVGPLALRLHAEMRSSFVESDFHLPTPGKPAHDWLGGNAEIGTQQRWRLEPLLGIADDHPPDRHGGGFARHWTGASLPYENGPMPCSLVFITQGLPLINFGERQ